MQKLICLFIFFSLFSLEIAVADIGLRPGLYIEIPDATADQKEYFLTPQLEYTHTFRHFDVYAKVEYTFGLTALYPQFFFAEERFAAFLPLGSRSEFRAALRNENDLRIDPDHDDGQGEGRVTPELKYSLFLPAGDFSLALGSPLTYPVWGKADNCFGLEVTAAYFTPLWVGFEALMDFKTIPAALVDGMKFAVNYTEDQFYGELAFRAKDSFTYFTLKAEFNYFFNFVILWGTLEAKNLSNRDNLVLTPEVGIKYRF
jgi:hypothetical protein